jgi:hypothetical protein
MASTPGTEKGRKEMKERGGLSHTIDLYLSVAVEVGSMAPDMNIDWALLLYFALLVNK